MIFCDTSMLAKLYVPELESEAVRRLVEGEDDVCASELARVELLGVFHRRRREGKWRQSEFAAATRQFHQDDLGGFWTWLPLDASILEAAAKVYLTLPEDIFLRSADCLHLVTALRHNFGEIHTYDQHQAKATQALGLRAVIV